MNRQLRNSPIHRYLLLIGIVLLIAIIGYSSFVLYPAMFASAGSGLILLAMAAGLASLFSPCSFPLLVTLLAREANTQSKRALAQSALAFTLGAALFLLFVGATLALGAGSAISQFTFTSTAGRALRSIVGVILIGFGIWQVRGKSLNFAWLNRLLQPLWTQQARLRRRRSSLSYGLYGFGYILAGFGWTGPILAGLALHALTVGSNTAAFYAFVVAALTMALVMAVLVIAIGFAQTHVVRSLKMNTRSVKRLGGAVLVVVGIWLIILAIWANVFTAIFFV